MRIDSSLESAFHIAVLLAAAQGREIAAANLADFHALSRPALAKLLQQLSAASLVTATAGRGGGYRLARAPEQINLYQIASAINGAEPTFHCREIRKKGVCAGSGSTFSARCAIARTMDKATDAWRQQLEGTSLAQLLADIAGDMSEGIRGSTTNWIKSHALPPKGPAS